MKYIKRISLIVVAVLVLACSVPLSSMAIDPVSAATMANAFAQAITAYGASQGVSMTFDVANTDGIGEGVHELWDQYASEMEQSNVTVSDYSNLAASVFPTLWKKTFDYVTVSLDAATVGEIDGFWNWLLSGPAEMMKVDNEYYEWTLNQNNTVDPILVYSDLAWTDYPYYNSTASDSTVYNNAMPLVDTYYTNSFVSFRGYYSVSGRHFNAFALPISNGIVTIIVFSPGNYSSRLIAYDGSYRNTLQSPTQSVTISGQSYWYTSITASGNTPTSVIYHVPQYQTINEGIQAYVSDPNASLSDLSIRPYVGDTAPQNVYIPDNTDVNYTPVAAEIPLDILWDDSLFGDGTGTLTDTQSEAITEAADDAITDNPDKTLELADTVNPPAPSPSEVYIPFLPVTLPSFQFSLSGIWHYVTAWVASLGAWFNLVFTTWSYLPYAISVPVYATAVIVIVLGVYKRFFM